MPRDLSEEVVAEWLWAVSSIEGDPAWDDANSPSKEQAFAAARAVRALVEATGEKVARQAYHAGYSACVAGIDVTTRIDADVYFIFARVMGDHPQGGHEAEGREAPRG
jgi:hypothetical protein